MNFRHPDLIALLDGRPMGLGSISSGSLPSGTIFPCCGRKSKKGQGLLTYADGDKACAECARAWCDANFTPHPAPHAPPCKVPNQECKCSMWMPEPYEPQGQGDLFGGDAA